jgi:transcriptional regulator with XRE-family HTH domain
MAAIDPRALRKAMDLAGMTPRQLAETLQLSHDYVLNIRNGHRRLKQNPAMRRRIADALNVPIHWIESKEADAA